MRRSRLNCRASPGFCGFPICANTIRVTKGRVAVITGRMTATIATPPSKRFSSKASSSISADLASVSQASTSDFSISIAISVVMSVLMSSGMIAVVRRAAAARARSRQCIPD